MATTISWHIQKHTSGQLVGLQNHNERKGKNHSNERIDPERSHLNYESDKGHLAEFKGKSYKQRFQSIMDERANEKAQVRKTSIVDVQHTVQFGGEAFQEASQEQRNEMMAKATKFVVDRFGGFDNVMSYNTHLDETNDHVHLDMVPLTEDGRLSARDLYSKGNLQAVQKDLLKYMQAEYPEFGFERASEADRGFANGKTQKDFEKLSEAKREADKVILKAEEAQEELVDTAELFNSLNENLIQSIVDTAPNETLTLEELEKQKKLFPDHGLTGELAEKPQPFNAGGETQIRALFRQPIQLINLLKRVTTNALNKTMQSLEKLIQNKKGQVKELDDEIAEKQDKADKLDDLKAEYNKLSNYTYARRKEIEKLDRAFGYHEKFDADREAGLRLIVETNDSFTDDLIDALRNGDPLYQVDVDPKRENPIYYADWLKSAIKDASQEELSRFIDHTQNHSRGPRM